MSGGKKTETTSNQQQTATTQLPAWMTGAGQGLYQDAAATAKANPITAYQGQRVEGLTANQQQAGATAAAGAGAWKPQVGAAGALTAGAATAGPAAVTAGQFGTAQAEQYANPWLARVQQNTLSQMRDQDGADRMALGDTVQGSGAFGGSRQAVLEATQAKDQARARQDYIDGSNAAGYEAARSQFNTDADRSLSAQGTNAGLYEQMLARMMGGGAQMGQLAETGSTLNTRDVAALSETGATAQATGQAARDAEYQEFRRMQDAPMDQYSQLMAILSGTPRNVTTTGTSSGTQTTKEKGSFLDTMLGLGQLGLSAYSGGMFGGKK